MALRKRRPRGPRRQDPLSPCLKVPGDENSRERKFQGAKLPGTELASAYRNFCFRKRIGRKRKGSVPALYRDDKTHCPPVERAHDARATPRTVLAGLMMMMMMIMGPTLLTYRVFKNTTYTMCPEKSNPPPQTMYDRNAKSQRILTELRAVDSEYVCERNKKNRSKILFDRTLLCVHLVPLSMNQLNAIIIEMYLTLR